MFKFLFYKVNELAAKMQTAPFTALLSTCELF